jgi:hypothetical protein
MSDFFASAKHLVNSAVSRTGWEAQKQLRIRSKQSEIDKLLEQRQQLLIDLSQAAMTLYGQGTLAEPQLSRICASIFELDHDLRTRETQLQDIKTEDYPANQLAPAPITNYAPPSVPQPSVPLEDDDAVGNEKCPQCGKNLRPNALYCRSCGKKIRS